MLKRHHSRCMCRCGSPDELGIGYCTLRHWAVLDKPAGHERPSLHEEALADRPGPTNAEQLGLTVDLAQCKVKYREFV